MPVPARGPPPRHPPQRAVVPADGADHRAARGVLAAARRGEELRAKHATSPPGSFLAYLARPSSCRATARPPRSRPTTGRCRSPRCRTPTAPAARGSRSGTPPLLGGGVREGGYASTAAAFSWLFFADCLTYSGRAGLSRFCLRATSRSLQVLTRLLLIRLLLTTLL
eukprot:gene8126-biopygen7984